MRLHGFSLFATGRNARCAELSVFIPSLRGAGLARVRKHLATSRVPLTMKVEQIATRWLTIHQPFPARPPAIVCCEGAVWIWH